MAAQDSDLEVAPMGLPRAFAIPVIALFIALLLAFTRIFLSEPPTDWRIVPESAFGRGFGIGIRTLAITFGLTCAPGILLGTVLANAVSRSPKLTLAALGILRIWQWIPFLTWWVLIHLLFFPFDQKAGAYFYLWAIGLPAVALGCCYQYLLVHEKIVVPPRTALIEGARIGVFRALFISIVMSLSIWMEPWVPQTVGYNVTRNHVTAVILAALLALVHWLYGSWMQCFGQACRQLLLPIPKQNDRESIWIAAIVLLAVTALWEVLNGLHIMKVSASKVVVTAITLVSHAETWIDIWASLSSVLVGMIVMAFVAIPLSWILSRETPWSRPALTILSLTFAIPMILLPAWHHTLMPTYGAFWGWYSVSVACLTLYPMIETLWALRKDPLIFRIAIAIEQALPYGFCAILYAEMMSSTAGWGFAQVKAGAAEQTAQGLSATLISIVLLFLLTFSMRKLAGWLCRSHELASQNPLSRPTSTNQ